MAEEVYYKKVGRKYVPVSYYDSTIMDGVPEGATLIVKQKNLTMRRYNVDIDTAPLMAAMMSLTEQVSKEVYKTSEARPHTRSLTDAQQKAWKRFIKKYGETFRFLEYPSCREIADNIAERFAKEVEQAHTNPAVKEAYEHYKFLLALTVKEQLDK